MTWGSRAVFLTSASLASVVLVGCGNASDHARGSRRVVHVAAGLASAQQGVPAPGMLRTVSEDGRFVGFVRQSDVMMPPKRYYETVDARTLWRVTDYDGKLVGYVAPDVPFVPLAVAEAPGFDIEKV